MRSQTQSLRVLKSPSMLRKVLLLSVALVSVSSLHAQSASPVRQPPPPRAIYAPKPVYRPEWAKQGLTGKGVVLVTIDRADRQRRRRANAHEHWKSTTRWGCATSVFTVAV